MSEKKEYISESSIKESPKKVLNIKLGNGVVKKENMADDSVGLSNLSQDVHQAMASLQVSGVALTGDFGDSEFIGIHQKALTEILEDLQNKVTAMATGTEGLSFISTPTLVFVGEEETITLVASTDTEANITIKRGTMEIATGEGYELETEIEEEFGTLPKVYTAEFEIAGIVKKITTKVNTVYPIYYGAGSAYTDAEEQAAARETPKGEYTITVNDSGDYIFFNVPATMNINSATMNNSVIPLDTPSVVLIDGVSYKSYKSSTPYSEGTVEVQII